MRFGLATVASIGEMSRTATLGERLGFDSVWSPDETVGYEMEYGPRATIPDVFGSLTTIADCTKKIHVGSSVVDGLIRHPAKMAQSAATLDSVSNGRFLLGIGASEAGNHEPFAIPTDNPYSRIKETIQIARLLWKSGYRNRVSYEGKFYTLKDAYLRIRPRRSNGPPIYVAAFGPRMLSIVGELGDGWIPFAHTPASYKSQLNGPIKQGLEKTSRTLRDIEPACIVPAALSTDKNRAQKRAMQVAKTYLVWSLDNMRLILPHVAHPGIRQTQLKTLSNLPQLVKLTESVPDKVALDLTISGTADDCRDQIARFAEAGCRHLIFVPISPNEAERLRMLKRLSKVTARF